MFETKKSNGTSHEISWKNQQLKKKMGDTETWKTRKERNAHELKEIANNSQSNMQQMKMWEEHNNWATTTTSSGW